MTGKTQSCRNCCHLHVGGAVWCRERGEAVSGAAAKSPNRCHSFAYTPVDAFGSRETGTGKKQKKKQCDGQMSLF